jgi:hypothetical protein
MNLTALRSELVSDPLARGYSGMSDAQASASLNTVNRSVHVATMSGSEVLQSIDKTEYGALTDGKKSAVWGLLGMGTLNPWGREADIVVEIFGGGSATVTALAAARTRTVSRAEELGLGVIRESDVTKARSGA